MADYTLTLKDETTEFLLYTAPNGEVKVEVLLNNETIWLTQKRTAELFGVGVPAVSKHLDNIYSSGELEQKATISILETAQQEGKREVKRKLEYDKFNKQQKLESDFDREVKKLLHKKDAEE
jgi:hypothetical protein